MAFYDMTPYELQLMLEGCEDKRRRDLEWQKYAIAFGIGVAFKGKDIKMFDQRKEAEKRSVSAEEKQRDLMYLNAI